jgi:hypothetical protein
MTLRSRPSRRDHLLAIRGQLDGLAALTGKPPPEYLTEVRAKRAPAKPSGKRLEKHVVNDIREWAQRRPDVTLWRNSRGMVELPGGGRLRYGVGPDGASDFLGYQTVRITQADVGKLFARFVAVESKAPHGEPSDDQITFIDRIQAAGGLAGIARSREDAAEIVK